VLDAYLTSVRTVFGWIRDRLTPEHRFGGEPHPGLERWERLRTWATIALVVFTTVRYQGISAGRVMGAMDSTFASAELALFALVPAMAVLLVVARPDSRRRQAGALVRPLLTMLAVSAAYLALFSTIVAFRILSPAALHQASFLTGLLLNCSGLVIALAILP